MTTAAAKLQPPYRMMQKTIPHDPETAPSAARQVRLSAETNSAIEPSLLAAISRLRQHLLSLAHPQDGSWMGKVEDNVTITAEYVMFLKFLDLADGETLRKTTNAILSVQNEDGGWGIYGGGPSDLSATVEAYFALKLSGLPARHRALQKARKAIQACGGIKGIRIFTRINLALFGQFPWREIPLIQPELMLLPKGTPFNIYEFSSWSRSVIIPLLIVANERPVKDIPREEGVQELFAGVKDYRDFDLNRGNKPLVSWESFFYKVQAVLKYYEGMPLKPFRKTALDLALRWVLSHQDRDGAWGGIFPAMINSILALHLSGYNLDHPRIQKGLRALRHGYAEEGERQLRIQSTVSPVWDTGLALVALRESGLSPRDPALLKAARWVMPKQIDNIYGDWQVKNTQSEPGGWAFEWENDFFPDLDDTAIVMQALIKLDLGRDNVKKTERIRRGLQWMLGMQCRDGGWGAFDKDNDQELLNEIPFADLKSLLDPSTPDIVGHVLETLGLMGYRETFPPIKRAINYLRQAQKDDGSFFGRWGVNYLYGTGSVLTGLAAVKFPMDDPLVERAVYWLEAVQNRDGGFGESPRSYNLDRYEPLQHSTASQTAWAMMALLAARGANHPAIRHAARYLIGQVGKNGEILEKEWTGTGFPRHFMLRYDYYRLYFPLLALSRYARQCGLDLEKAAAGSKR